MIRSFNIFCAILAGSAGLFLYTKKHNTTVLDQNITSIVRKTERIQQQTAMLRTQWELMNQPDHLAALSARLLGKLHPMSPDQYVRLSSVIGSLPQPSDKPAFYDPRDNVRLTLNEAPRHQSHLSSTKPRLKEAELIAKVETQEKRAKANNLKTNELSHGARLASETRREMVKVTRSSDETTSRTQQNFSQQREHPVQVASNDHVLKSMDTFLRNADNSSAVTHASKPSPAKIRTAAFHGRRPHAIATTAWRLASITTHKIASDKYDNIALQSAHLPHERHGSGSRSALAIYDDELPPPTPLER